MSIFQTSHSKKMFIHMLSIQFFMQVSDYTIAKYRFIYTVQNSKCKDSMISAV